VCAQGGGRIREQEEFARGVSCCFLCRYVGRFADPDVDFDGTGGEGSVMRRYPRSRESTDVSSFT
jgi:hypothetical protein